MKKRFLTLALLVALLLVVASVAQARKGPRASVGSATQCALDLEGGGAFLVVTTTLNDKSSGDAAAELRGGTIAGTYKAIGSRGNANTQFDSDNAGDLVTVPQDIGTSLVIMTQFDVCGVFEDARELNGKATIDYGTSGGGGQTRTVMNRCSDDPDTEDVWEGAIKVADYADLIAAACAP